MRSFVFPALIAACAVSAACSSTDSSEPETYTREKLLDPETCNECHQDHYKEWSGSMHAYASQDPVFRAMNARGQEETQGELGSFCVNCHAPMAVAEKATTDGLNLDSVPKNLQGVTCYFCHNVKEVQDTHLSNNPLLLANDVTMRGAIKDPVKYKAHKSEYAAHLDGRQLAPSSKMCGTCHDIVVPGHFSGAPKDVLLEQTYAEWQTTVFAVEGKSQQSCGDCHTSAALFPSVQQPIAAPPNSTVTMPVRDARHEHLFFGVDTAHEDFPEKDVQTARIQDVLDQSIRVQTCVQVPGGSVAITIENQLAGHNLPSGASIDRRMWVEAHVFEGDKETYQTGVIPTNADVDAAYEASVTAGDPIFTLWDKATKSDGTTKAHMFWDVANVKRDSIPGLLPGLSPTIANGRVLSFSSVKGGTFRPSKVTATVWLEPIGRDLVADLEHSGHLAAGAVTDIPRYPLLPKRNVTPDAETNPITLTWTDDPEAWDLVDQGAQCTQTSARAGTVGR